MCIIIWLLNNQTFLTFKCFTSCTNSNNQHFVNMTCAQRKDLKPYEVLQYATFSNVVWDSLTLLSGLWQWNNKTFLCSSFFPSQWNISIADTNRNNQHSSMNTLTTNIQMPKICNTQHYRYLKLKLCKRIYAIHSSILNTTDKNSSCLNMTHGVLIANNIPTPAGHSWSTGK